MKKEEKVDLYGAINQLLSKCQSNYSPAEFHGLVCGLLCGGKRDKEIVLQEILPTEPIDCENKELQWVDFFIDTAVDALNAPQFSFQPLLPSESFPLAERIAAVSDWCRGTVYGIGLAETPSQQLDRDNQELLNDLITFSQISAEMSENMSKENQAEESLMEIIEYARVGVMGLFLDWLQANNKTENKTGNNNE